MRIQLALPNRAMRRTSGPVASWLTSFPTVLVTAALALYPSAIGLAQNPKVQFNKDALSPALQDYVNQARQEATDQANQKNNKAINDLRQQLRQAIDERDRWQKIAAAGNKPQAAADNAYKGPSPAVQALLDQARQEATAQADQKNSKAINDLRQQLRQAIDERDRWQKIAAAGNKSQAAADNANQRLAKAEGELEVARKQLTDSRQAFNGAQASAKDANDRAAKADAAADDARNQAADARKAAEKGQAAADDANQRAKAAETAAADAIKRADAEHAAADAARAEREQMKVAQDRVTTENDNLKTQALDLNQQVADLNSKLAGTVERFAAIGALALVLAGGLGLGLGRTIFKPPVTPTVGVSIRLLPAFATTRIEGAAPTGPALRIGARLVPGATECHAVGGGAR